MEYKGQNKSSFARAIGIDPSRMTHIFSGHNEPTLDMVRRIVLAFPDISSEWLISGIGNMVKTEVVEMPTENSQEAQVLINKVDNMQQTSLFSNDLFSSNPLEPSSVAESVIGGDSTELQIDTQDTDRVIKSAQITEVEAVQSGENQRGVSPVVDTPKVLQPSKPASQSVRSRVKAAESNNLNMGTKRDRISNSQADKKIVKIVFFYDDRSFEEYRPS